MIIQNIKKYINKALLPTIVISLIFFLNFYFFGLENTIIGPFVTLSFIRFKNMNDHYSCMTKTFLIYIVMSILAYLALINLTLCILINAAALFWIAYYLIDEYNPTNYFPAGMALIFFQILPVQNINGLAVRWLALFASFLIIFAFLIVLFKSKKVDPLNLFVRNGLELSKEIIELFESDNKQDLPKKQLELHKINQNISSEIYLANRASFRKDVYANRYCIYVAFFQIINYAINEFLSDDSIENLDSSYMINNFEVIKNMQHNFECAFNADILATDTHKFKFRDPKIDIRSFRLRFALRMVITVTPCLVFAYLSPFNNAYWLSISVFFMMIPLYENTYKRVIDRTKGTIAGIFICFILFTIFNEMPARITIMTIANFLIYCSSSYVVTVTYITCSALALYDLTGSTIILLSQRFLYTIAGAIVTLFANRFIFSIRSESSISYIKELLDDIRNKANSFSTLGRSEKKYQINRLIIKSYLLSNTLDDFANSLKDKNKCHEVKEYQKMHMLSITNWLMKSNHSN